MMPQQGRADKKKPQRDALRLALVKLKK